MAEVLDSDQVKKWVLEMLSNQTYDTVEIKITGTSEKGEGYIGDITFAKVFYTRNSVKGVLDVVVKSGKQSKSLRDKFPMKMAYEREIFMYNTIVPLFQRLESECPLEYLKEFLPRAYGSILRDGEEVLLLENLKSAGYELNNKFQALNISHLNLTLKTYGKFHALGMAYKHKYPVEFQEKIVNLPPFATDFSDGFSFMFTMGEKIMFAVLEEAGELDLSEKLKARFPKGVFQAYTEVFNKKSEENCTLIHGDCWNNNYMYRYNGLDRSQPEAVAFLDFQLARASSPVIDLSYHLYSNSSDVELAQFDHLMETYYQSLSTTLKELNCNPEEIFTFSELQRQWNIYSTLGFVIGTCALPLVFTDKEDSMDIQDIGQKETMERLGHPNGKHHKLLASRMLAAAKHFLNNSFGNTA